MKIYHYTTIENLALILHYKTLRFNNARNVNDPEEAITEDFGSLKDYLFISCWSKASNESIPLWKMYANSGKGIRLELDTEHIHLRGLEDKNGLNCVVQNVVQENETY